MKEKTKKLILYILLCTVSLSAIYSSIKLNENRIYNDNKQSYISNTLLGIKYEDLNNYLMETTNGIIYVSNSSSEDSLKFEKKFNKVIEEYELENDIVFININDTNIVDPLYQNAPQLLFYKSNEVIDMIDCKTLKNKKDILKVLKERSVIDD